MIAQGMYIRLFVFVPEGVEHIPENIVALFVLFVENQTIGNVDKLTGVVHLE